MGEIVGMIHEPPRTRRIPYVGTFLLLNFHWFSVCNGFLGVFSPGNVALSRKMGSKVEKCHLIFSVTNDLPDFSRGREKSTTNENDKNNQVQMSLVELLQPAKGCVADHLTGSQLGTS